MPAMMRRWNIYVDGRLSINGKKFIYVEHGENRGYLPQIMVINDKAAKEILAHQGVLLPDNAWKQVQQDVFYISEYNSDLIADRPGWNGDAFVFTTEDVTAADDQEIKVVAANVDPRRSAKMGSLEGWLQAVAEPLTGQSLPMFLMMAALTAPLLRLIRRRENPAFEIGGKPGSGKSTLFVFVMSVFGEPSVEMFNATLDGLESSMNACSDQPLMLDDGNLFYGDETGPKRIAKWKALPFRLADGRDKKRYGIEQGDRSYFTTLITTNQPMTEVIAGEHPSVVAAAADRLLSLVIAEDRPHQTFDFVPEKYESAGAFAKALELAASANHGHAMAKFVGGLVGELTSNREALMERIDAHIALWKHRVGITDEDGSISRTGNAFGLCYAAGEEAKRHGALPESWRCGQAVKAVYRTFYARPQPQRPFDKQFADYLKHPKVRNLDTAGLRPTGEKLFEATPAYIHTNPKTVLEALVRQEALDAAIPGWPKLIQKPGVRCVLDRDRDHLTKKRQVRRGPTDRMVVIRIPKDFLKD